MHNFIHLFFRLAPRRVTQLVFDYMGYNILPNDFRKNDSNIVWKLFIDGICTDRHFPKIEKEKSLKLFQNFKDLILKFCECKLLEANGTYFKF